MEEMFTKFEKILTDLGVKYEISRSSQEVDDALFIKCFGSINGIVVRVLDDVIDPPIYEIDYKGIRTPLSRVSPDFLRSIGKEDAEEMLRDWGFFGPKEETPLFLFTPLH